MALGTKIRQLLVHAGNVLRATQQVDYERVLEHHEPSVSYMHQVLEVACSETERIKDLGMLADDPGPQPYAFLEKGKEPPLLLNESIERKRMNIELINDMGYGTRIGHVYSSIEDRGRIKFEEIGKKVGLPNFELVLAPDVSPRNSVAGVFVDEVFVSLAVLRHPMKVNEWMVEVKKPYSDPMAMLDLVKRMVTRDIVELRKAN